jgi:hypothetical protein
MPDVSPRALRLERYVLPTCLLAQACLLLTRLDLLPVWGDEHFTLLAASQSLSGLLVALVAAYPLLPVASGSASLAEP